MKKRKDVQLGNFEFLDLEKLDNVFSRDILEMLGGTFYKLFDIFDFNVFWKNTKGEFMGCNKAMLKVFNLSHRDELIGKTDKDFLTEEDLLVIQQNDRTVMEIGKSIRLEETATCPDGKKVYYLSVKQPLKNAAGEITGVFGISLNITDLKQAQEKERIEKKKREDAENAMKEEQAHRKAVSVHSGSMAHDLKNPILANNLANEMNQIVLKKLQEKYQIPEEDLRPVFAKMDLIKANNDKMSAMIEASNQMIQDIASENPELIQQEFSVYSLIKESLHNYFEDVQSGLIQFDLPQDFKFFTNKIAFLRIMFNLIDNAKRQIKLKNRGKIYISAEQTADFSIIKIKDTAGSVTEDLVKNIFSLYKTKKVQNTGLGLQAVSSLMQSQDGFVHARLVDEEYIEFVLGFKCF